MRLLGAHMSVAGGFYKAVEASAAAGMNTVQIFTNSPSQWVVATVPPRGTRTTAKRETEKLWRRAGDLWRSPLLADDAVAQFQDALHRHGIRRPIAHSSYLINLASTDRTLWRRSVEAMVVEIERAAALGIAHVVVHPGATVSASEATGIRNVIRAVNEVQRRTLGLDCHCLLENTAGQGSCLGWRFEHLGRILQGVKDQQRIGVCIDTCHAFAAGYPLAPADRYAETMDALDQAVGVQLVRALHLNDSKRELGSRVDRHEHIGAGKLGLEPFRHLLHDPRFAAVPMYLETPKGKRDGKDLDRINLRTLMRLARKPPT
jgi:deoxyribonuclease-4